MVTCMMHVRLVTEVSTTTQCFACVYVCMRVLSPGNACTQATDKEIVWFWNILRGLSNEYKALFLQFVTGAPHTLECLFMYACIPIPVECA